MTPHVHRKSTEPDEARRLKVKWLYEESYLSLSEIGKILGVTKQAVRQMLLRMGVKMRPRGGDTTRYYTLRTIRKRK